MPHAVTPDDQSSELQDPGDQGDPQQHDQELPTEIEQVQVQHQLDHGSRPSTPTVKITTDSQKEDRSPFRHPGRATSLSTTTEHVSDAASIHSMPAVHITEPSPQSPTEPHSPTSADAIANHPPPSPSRSQLNSPITPQERSARHRSALEVRSSNRLSGFFTNLIHRRDHPPNSSMRSPLREGHPPEAPSTEQTTEVPSRPPSPPPRPITPPPPLPPPTLQELGLSLSVLTSDLSPSHFSTPPSSGAFLAPHYLLLCHAQGLDVLPIVSPPAPQPYALVRRVSFKSVVVMEQRGVLVAIAGRRDGVRVYALEEVKRAVEWRIEVEVRRERERMRREMGRRIFMGSPDGTEQRNTQEKLRKSSLSTPPPGSRSHPLRRGSTSIKPVPPTSPPPSQPPAPLVPRGATTQKPISHIPPPSGNPPPYSPTSSHHTSQIQNNDTVGPAPSLRPRGASISNVLAAVPHTSRSSDSIRHDGQEYKAEWVESSDEEAIDIVAAGSSGGQALDERTSAQLSATTRPQPLMTGPRATSSLHVAARPSISSSRRSRPSNLDLSNSRASTDIPPPEPSPVPTLITLRQALAHPPSPEPEAGVTPISPSGNVEDEDDASAGRISLAQALLESRIPELPPLGSRRPQQPILITSSHPIATGEDEPSSPRTSDGHVPPNRPTSTERPQRRRRWSVLIGQSASSPVVAASHDISSPPLLPDLPVSRFRRSRSFRSNDLPASQLRPSDDSLEPHMAPPVATSPEPAASIVSADPPQTSRTSRFIPRIISNAFHGRRSDDRPTFAVERTTDSTSTRRNATPPNTVQAPPPKLEYVKLPGTKGALMVKAVETAKKSFLAILCGENGEKVELFAGTYRTALGLSRTFILPDSPRSLELQLQGDDLVEVFLVFSQNVFGLEPATVRVREVRIGRAERRAARRRAREIRSGDNHPNDSEAPVAEEDTNVTVSIGVSVTVGSTVVATGERQTSSPSSTLVNVDTIDTHNDPSTTSNDATAPSTTINQAEEALALATTQMGPYTTFQQLSFAPKFPLASIADEYIIPPTYPDFLEYRAEHEPDATALHGTGLAHVQFSPPGLPIPTPSPPSRWYYRDPKNVIHGPWKASLMQAWYKDGLLPPDLPVRREEDTEYLLLRDLRLQSVDPTHPFRSQPTPPPPLEISKPLLPPISLLAQPRHFGPPAMFFSSRGGHSTTIVDARGRSVLKGRFVWSEDDHENKQAPGRMGDVRRIEAFDVNDRAVLVAMRQGGLEAMDLGDALLKPADESRTVLPQFSPNPSSINRRGPFVWKIGTPVTSSSFAGGADPLPMKVHVGQDNRPAKKQSIGAAKSPGHRTEFSLELDVDNRDEVLFLGRKDDEIYFCERNAGSFRILRLCALP